MKKIICNVWLITGLVFGMNATTNAQINTIRFDTTFGTNGILSNSAPQNYNEAMCDMAIQADGKIVVAGSSGNAGRGPTVIRFLSTGVVDSTFGTAGYVYLDQPYDIGSTAGAVKLISNGRMLVSGCDDANYNGFMNYFVARLDSTGALDTTFGTEGYTYFKKGKRLLPPQMVLLADGSVISEYPIANSQSALFKVDSNGEADNSFGVNDSLLITELSIVSSIKLDNNGNILVAGSVSDTSAFGIVRLLPNGQRDNTFGNNGLGLYSYYDSSSSGYIGGESPIPVVEPNGDILVSFIISTSSDIVATMRLFQNGTVDGSYGKDGGVLSLTYAQLDDVLLMPNDELVIAGTFSVNDYISPLADVAVITNSGRLDTVFPRGAASIVFALDTSATNTISTPSTLRLLPDNKLLLGGAAEPSLSTIAFARFNYTGFVTTGIAQPAPVGDMQLYPNPANSYAVIQYPLNEWGAARVNVFDMLGNLVLQSTISGQPSVYRVDATRLVNGVYTIEIRSGQQVATRKLVVQH